MSSVRTTGSFVVVEVVVLSVVVLAVVVVLVMVVLVLVAVEVVGLQISQLKSHWPARGHVGQKRFLQKPGWEEVSMHQSP